MTHQLLGNAKRGIPFIVSAPAGTGKTTLVGRLRKEFPDQIVQSISCTTRSPRNGEKDGDHYHFLTNEEFETRSQAGDFLEEATVFGNRYGTPRNEVEHLLDAGKHVILVIDTQGALELMESYSARFIFIAPPSFEELERRLHGRQSEGEEIRKTRLEWAEEEMQKIKHYDYLIVNDDLEVAYNALRSIIIAEDHAMPNQK